jgi:hypothetical protein
MSVASEIQTAGWRLIRGVTPAKSTQLRFVSFARDPDLIVVLGFVVVGLVLSVLFPLSTETTIQLAQMP